MARKRRSGGGALPEAARSRDMRDRVRRSGVRGDTFSVARALDQASLALGSVLYRPGDKPLRRHPDRGVPDRPALDVAKAVDPRRVEPVRTERPLTLDKPKVETCKGRPSERQSRGGGGGSRPFVPWCDRRS